MKKTEWIVTKYCRDNIKKLGFIYTYPPESWSISFPIYKKILFCDVNISTDFEYISVNVKDTFGQPYPPWYTQEFGRYDDYLNKINRTIQYKLKKLGIIKKRGKKNE